VKDRFPGSAALDALIDRGEETRAPERLAARRIRAAADQDDEAGQLLALGAEAPGDPGAHARAAGAGRSGVEKELRGRVVELVGPHRLDEGDVVHELAELRQELADPGAALPVLTELVRRAKEFRDAFDEGEALVLEQLRGAVLHVQFVQLWLIVEH